MSDLLLLDKLRAMAKNGQWIHCEDVGLDWFGCDSICHEDADEGYEELPILYEDYIIAGGDENKPVGSLCWAAFDEIDALLREEKERIGDE